MRRKSPRRDAHRFLGYRSLRLDIGIKGGHSVLSQFSRVSVAHIVTLIPAPFLCHCYLCVIAALAGVLWKGQKNGGKVCHV